MSPAPKPPAPRTPCLGIPESVPPAPRTPGLAPPGSVPPEAGFSAPDPGWSRAVRRHVHAPTHDWFAVCAPGLEALLADEMRQVGLADVVPTTGGAGFRGRLADGYAANLRLRLANRILVRVASFPARAPEDIVRHAREVPWEAWLPTDVPLRIDVAAHESRMASTGLIATKVTDALQDRMATAGLPMPSMARRGAPEPDDDPDDGPSDEHGPMPQRLLLRLHQNRLTVSLDASGHPLHRRGYRTAVTTAPIRETLAAGILRFAGYDDSLPLCDPMCGSGTFPIEAAWIASGFAPGRGRTFAFMQWPSYRPATWGHLTRAARALEHVPLAPIHGSDRDPRALAAAGANADRADVGGILVLQRCDFANLAPPRDDARDAPFGLVVMNPPYGLRLEADAHTTSMVRDIGRRLRAAWRGWRFAIVLPSQRLVPLLQLPTDSEMRLAHGGLTVTVVRGRVP